MAITSAVDARADEPPTQSRAAFARRVATAGPYAAVVVPLLVAAVRVVIIDRDIELWGDQALIALAARRTLTGDHLLGAYSRYGWHHPGPAWLFGIGALGTIGGSGGTAAVVAGIALQALAAALIVAVAKRLGGRGGAWLGALTVLAVMQTSGIAERMAWLWNPWAIVLPTLLFLLLCAGLADAGRRFVPWAAAVVVCASFLVQTHVSTVLLAAALPLGALVLRVVVPRVTTQPHALHRPNATPRYRFIVAAAAIALVVMWSPPLIDQLTGSPGNITLLIDHTREPGDRPSMKEARIAVGNELRAFPFAKDTPRPFAETDPTIYRRMDRVGHLPYIYLGAAALVVVIALRRNLHVAAALAALGGLGVVVAVLAATMADGPLFPYLLAWATVLPAAVWGGAAAIVIDWTKHAGHPAQPALAALALLLSAVCAYQAGTNAQLDDLATFPGGREAWALVEPIVGDESRPVVVDLSTGGAMPVAAAVIDQLDQRGRNWSVEHEWEYLFGDGHEPPGGTDPIRLYFARVEDSVPVPADAVEVGIARSTRAYVIDD